MKRNIILRTAAALSAAAFMLSSCTFGHGDDEETGETAPPAETEVTLSDAEMPFSSYMTEVTDGTDNYLMTVKAENGLLSVSLEDKEYRASTLDIVPPEGFSAVIPASGASAHDVCKIVTNDVDKRVVVPDIIQFFFTDGNDRTVSRFYSIKDGRFGAVEIYDTADSGSEPVRAEYLDRSAIYHSEPDKFITSIVVDESVGIVSDISGMVKIHTMKFDPEKMQLTGGYENISENNPLYFGYAYWGLANNAASYFTETLLNIESKDKYVRMKSDSAPDGIYYYFYTNDARFGSCDDMREYLKSLFTDDIANRLFTNAPQRYRDIKDRLCTLAQVSDRDRSLGMLTFSSYEISGNGSIMTFSTRQEKYDEDGVFKGYTDGGKFQIIKIADWVYDVNDNTYYDEERWIVSSYRYPYS